MRSWVKLVSTPITVDYSSFTTTGSTITASSNSFGGSVSTNDDRTTVDLGAINDEEFVLRFKYDITAFTNESGNSGQLYMGLTDKDNSNTVFANRDGLGFYVIKSGSSGMFFSYPDGNNWTTSGSFTQLSTSPSQTAYYVEIERTSSTSATLKLYSDEYVTLLETQTVTIPSGLTGLQYLTMGAWDNGMGDMFTVSVSDVTVDVPFSGTTKLLGLNDVTFNVGTTTASVEEATTTGGVTTQATWGNTQSDTIEDFSTWTSSNGGSNHWSPSGNSNLQINAGSYFKITKSQSGSYINSQFVFNNQIPDNADWKFRYKTSGTWNMYGSGVQSYDDSYQIFVQNSGGTSRVGHIQEQVGWQCQPNGGVCYTLTSPAGNENRKAIGYYPSSATYWVEYDVSKSTSTYTLNVYTSAGYSGTPAHSYTYTGAKVDALTGIDRVKIQDNSWNGLGGFNAWIDDIELIVDTTAPTTNTIISATGLSDNTSSPQHYSFTRDGNDWEIYQNGAQVGSTVTDTTSLGANTGTGQVGVTWDSSSIQNLGFPSTRCRF